MEKSCELLATSYQNLAVSLLLVHLPALHIFIKFHYQLSNIHYTFSLCHFVIHSDFSVVILNMLCVQLSVLCG